MDEGAGGGDTAMGMLPMLGFETRTSYRLLAVLSVPTFNCSTLPS